MENWSSLGSEKSKARSYCSILLGILALCFTSNGALSMEHLETNSLYEDDPTRDSFSIYMPDVKPTKPETYLCTPVRVDPTTNYYIVGFTPNATMDVAHHMLLYGCTEPGSKEEVYNCGEMSSARQPGLRSASPCSKGSQVIYAWARDAPELNLPPGVGFNVGGRSPVQYLVLQVHYADVTTFVEGGKTDDSGVLLHHTEIPQPKAAGVFLLGTNGFIPPKSTEFMEAACTINENVVIHPFAYRVHTHSLGRIVTGYRVRKHNGQDEWTLIGKKNPMRPQMFYPIENEMSIVKGDVVAARCTMVSDRNRVTRIGPTNEDEMCNFYLMYWMEGVESLKQKYCFTMGPPFYYWGRGGLPLSNIPDKEASSI